MKTEYLKQNPEQYKFNIAVRLYVTHTCSRKKKADV